MVVYDPIAGRWIATVTADYSTRQTNSAVLIAVSQSNDPTQGWYRRRVVADSSGTNWADRPTVGFNSKWIAVQASMYHNTGTGDDYVKTHIWLLNKTNFYAGGTNAPTLIVDTTYYGGQTPAVTLDNDPNLYLVKVSTALWHRTGYPDCRFLRVFRVAGGFGSETMAELEGTPTTSALYEYSVSTNWTGLRGLAPQLGSDIRIHVGTARMQNVVCRNGSLWCAHMVVLPYGGWATNTAIQWWEISTNGVTRQSGRIVDPAGAKFYAYPSICANRFGDALIGYSVFSATQYAGAAYSFRAFYDEQNSLRPEVQFLAGEGAYYNAGGGLLNRWGDYSASVADPLNDTDLWTVQEAAAAPDANADEGKQGRWKVRWAKIHPPSPGNDNFADAQTVAGVQASVTNSFLRATAEAQEPNHGTLTGATAASVWHQWTAPTTGPASLTTVGTLFPAEVAVYTGNAPGSLSRLVTSYTGAGSRTPGTARVQFVATNGVTYRIAVAGPNGVWESQASYVLSLNQPSAPFFSLSPLSGDVVIGYSLLLTAEAVASPAPTFQWQLNATNISGATTNTYSLQATSTNQTGNYRLIANNAYGSRTSSVAFVKVWPNGAAPLADVTYDGSGIIFRQNDVTNYLYAVQASTNLVQWENLATNRVPYSFTNAVTTNYPVRFYRTLFLGQ